MARPRHKARDEGTVAAVPPDAPPPGGLAVVTEDDIARRAYALYLARGGGHGEDQADWLQAERELRGPTS